MQIPTHYYDTVRQIDVNDSQTVAEWTSWEKQFANNTDLLPKVEEVKRALGSKFTRSDVVNFYKEPKIAPEIKFIAAMIWGHESDGQAKRDGRGPWKLEQTFQDSEKAESVIRSCVVTSNAKISDSYSSLKKTLKRCGPNFFTKHFYFLGKASGLKNYPLIFDNRVAQGLARMTGQNSTLLQMISVTPNLDATSYQNYLTFAHGQAALIGCEPDQVELFLFNFGTTGGRS